MLSIIHYITAVTQDNNTQHTTEFHQKRYIHIVRKGYEKEKVLSYLYREEVSFFKSFLNWSVELTI